MINGKTVVDVHMDFLPEDLFKNDWLREGFLNCIPSMYTEYSAFIGAVPETGVRQKILEKPKGYQNLNYVEGDYSLDFKAVQLACHYGNLYIDDDAFGPLFTLINEINVPYSSVTPRCPLTAAPSSNTTTSAASLAVL